MCGRKRAELLGVEISHAVSLERHADLLNLLKACCTYHNGQLKERWAPEARKDEEDNVLYLNLY